MNISYTQESHPHLKLLDLNYYTMSFFTAVITVSYDLDVVDENVGNIQFEVEVSTGVFYESSVKIMTMAGSATGDYYDEGDNVCEFTYM